MPRYTSYPTAPHFHAGVGAETYGEWLAAIAPGEAISLYVHIPFCDRLCWFCACHTKQVRRYEPVAEFLTALHAEVALVGKVLPKAVRVRALHFGGGSPTMLKPRRHDRARPGDAQRLSTICRTPRSASRSTPTTWTGRASTRWPRSA